MAVFASGVRSVCGGVIDVVFKGRKEVRKRTRLALHKTSNFSEDNQDAESKPLIDGSSSSEGSRGVADYRLDKPQEDGSELLHRTYIPGCICERL